MSRARQGDTDRVVACVVSAADRTEFDAPSCLDVDDRQPIEDRRVTELTVGWGELAVASTAPDEGGFDVFGYDVAANLQVGEETNVATEVFECAVESSIADERTPLLNSSRDAEGWNTYSLATGTDVRWCFCGAGRRCPAQASRCSFRPWRPWASAPSICSATSSGVTSVE